MKNVTVIRNPMRPVGLGDAVAFVATPIARALKLSCIDPQTKQLRPDAPCSRRKAAWNQAVPNIGLKFGAESSPKQTL